MRDTYAIYQRIILNVKRDTNMIELLVIVFVSIVNGDWVGSYWIALPGAEFEIFETLELNVMVQFELLWIIVRTRISFSLVNNDLDG